MTKISKESLITGAKKAGKCVSILALATTLAFANPLTAAAHVDSQNIIGEEQTYEDRTEIKRSEANTINNHFIGYDYWGDRCVTIEQVEKAMELSNVLNSYNNYEVNEYSNTRPSEVLNLNIDDLYNEYLADYKYGYNNFCRRNMTLKPAIDAYLNFACGTISSEIREEIETAAYNALYNEGAHITSYPSVRVKDDIIYCFARIDGRVRMIQLNTENITGLEDTLAALDNRYGLVLNNIAGYTENYPNAFAYNGIDSKTGESAWLSLCDDDLKGLLSRSIDTERNMECNVSMDLNNERYYVWDYQDVEAMRFFGFTEEEIRNTIKINGTVTYTNQLVK